MKPILRPFQRIESLIERVNGLKAAAPVSQSGDSISCSGLNRLVSLLLLAIVLMSGSACTTASAEPVAEADESTREDGGNTTAESVDEFRIHTLRLGPSNAYLLENENGLILVDAGLVLFDQMILQRMEEIGRDDLRLIFITHAHIDHYGGAAALRRKTGAPIAIHPDDAEAMAAGETRLGTIRDWGWVSDASLPAVEQVVKVEATPADVLLEDGDTLAEYGFANAVVIHTPGHTPGSTSLMVNGTHAFLGDLVSSTGGPHAQSSYAHSWRQLSRSLQEMQALHPAIVYAGHGALPISAADFQQLKVTIGIGD
jgi:glyoxylase-like metal-dependent hydrolase (beta-lactamase superfamily II)